MRLRGAAGESQNRDVILLPEGLGCLRNGLGGLSRQNSGTLEAQKITGAAAGLYNAVSDQSKLRVFREVESGFRVDRFGHKSKWQAVLHLQLLALKVRSEVPCVGNGERAILCDAKNEAKMAANIGAIDPSGQAVAIQKAQQARMAAKAAKPDSTASPWSR